nr:hypothetical protein GCM10017547_27670 [Pseudarthrobacter oxydans]
MPKRTPAIVSLSTALGPAAGEEGPGEEPAAAEGAGALREDDPSGEGTKPITPPQWQVFQQAGHAIREIVSRLAFMTFAKRPGTAL